jgi:hypothetical protein
MFARLHPCLLPCLLLAGLTGMPAHAAPSLTVTSPQELPLDDPRPRVFLAGSIDMGQAQDWQAQVQRALADDGVVLLNPRRDDWNPAWQANTTEPEFVRQVQWELDALDAADVVLMYFAPGSQSPVTLLEFGLHARGGKLLVAAPEGFWRKGNVDITADHYGVQRHADLPALIAGVRARLVSLAATALGDANTDADTGNDLPDADPARVY